MKGIVREATYTLRAFTVLALAESGFLRIFSHGDGEVIPDHSESEFVENTTLFTKDYNALPI